MAMKSLPQIRGLFRAPQLLHRWQIEIPTWPSAAQPSNPDILFFVTTAGLPTPTITDAMIELGGFPMSFNGKETRNGELEWKFFENVNQEVAKYFLVTYPNARQNHAGIADISLRAAAEDTLIAPVINMNLFDHTGEVVTMTYQLINAKFKTSSLGGELGQEATPSSPGVTVTYDSFIIRPNV